MPGKPPGSIVSLSWDGWQVAHEGDVIETDATGRRYEILSVRVQQRGKHTGRQHLTCRVMEPDEPYPEGVMIHSLRWYPRPRKRS